MKREQKDSRKTKMNEENETRVEKERRRQCVKMRAEERDRGVCRRIGKCNENAMEGKKEEKKNRHY